MEVEGTAGVSDDREPNADRKWISPTIREALEADDEADERYRAVLEGTVTNSDA